MHDLFHTIFMPNGSKPEFGVRGRGIGPILLIRFTGRLHVTKMCLKPCEPKRQGLETQVVIAQMLHEAI